MKGFSKVWRKFYGKTFYHPLLTATFAVSQGKMAQQQLFINADMNPKLLEAAKNGNRSQIIEFLDKRADIECHDPTNGSTPLMVAARVGAKNAVEYLIKRGMYVYALTMRITLPDSH